MTLELDLDLLPRAITWQKVRGQSFQNNDQEYLQLDFPYWKLALLGVAVILVSCATVEPEKPWPQGAAPREHFVRHYRADAANQRVQTREEYLYWVRRFYKGYSLVPGWFSITRQILKSLDGDHHTLAEQELYELGERIGSEWAKDNGVRRIDTRTTAIWGQAAMEAARRGDLENFLGVLRDDVESLLAGRTSVKEISLERYYRVEVDPF